MIGKSNSSKAILQSSSYFNSVVHIMLTNFYTVSYHWNNFTYISKILATFSHSSNNSSHMLTEFSMSMMGRIKVFHSSIIIHLCSLPGQHSLVVKGKHGLWSWTARSKYWHLLAV